MAFATMKTCSVTPPVTIPMWVERGIFMYSAYTSATEHNVMKQALKEQKGKEEEPLLTWTHYCCCARLSTTPLRPKSTCTRWLIPLFWNLQMLATALLGRPVGFLPRTHNSTRCRIEYRQGVNVRQTKHMQVHTRTVPTGKDNRACKELQSHPGGYNIKSPVATT